MMRVSRSFALGAILFATLVVSGCHYGRDTAGRPEMEDQEKPGSTAATKEGTGDPKVGSGRGQVGTDAPPKEPQGAHTDIPAK